MQIGLETLIHGNPLQVTLLCSTTELSLGEVNVNLLSHCPLWRLSTWRLRRPLRSCYGCGDSSPSWATETMIPTCSLTIRVLSRSPRIQSHMPEPSTLMSAITLSVMQFRIMSFGYSMFPQRI